LRHVSAAAQRLQALLEVADMLTETPEMTEMQVIALDVLLAFGRTQASEVMRQLAQMSGTEWDAKAPPVQ
jgi:hypothetical protein